MKKTNTSQKNLFLTIASVFLISLILSVCLTLYQEQQKNRCQDVAYSRVTNPNELAQISIEEKQELGIDPELTPTNIYYETMKCLKNK